jgi:hypothetical protein
MKVHKHWVMDFRRFFINDSWLLSWINRVVQFARDEETPIYYDDKAMGTRRADSGIMNVQPRVKQK